MKLDIGARCHDLCPKMEMERVFGEVRDNHIHQIQLIFPKSMSNYDFTTGHYSPGFARYIASKLEGSHLRVAVLGCYVNPVNLIEARRRAGVARLIKHSEYARILGADVVGTETGRLDPDFNITGETYTEDAYRLLLKSMKEIVSAVEKLGVMVGVEGMFNHTLYNPARMKCFLEDTDSPNVEVILDAVNLIHPDQVRPEQQRQVIDRVFSYHSDRISVLHVKDLAFDGKDQLFRHVGEGLSYYSPLMGWVKETKSHITMLLESSNGERLWKSVELLQRICSNIWFRKTKPVTKARVYICQI